MEKLLVAMFLGAVGLNYAGAAGYHCDFENGMCGLVNAATNDVGCGWTLRKGLGVTLDSGPFVDHTYQTPNGTYLYFQSSSCQQEASEDAVGVVLPTKGFVQKSICLKFWYLMYGNGDNFMLILSQDKDQIDNLFWRIGNTGRSWRFAQVSVNLSSESPLTFWTYGNQSYADIALDDIDVSDGACGQAVGLCDFENGDLCGFSVPTATGEFKWKNGDGLTVGNTLGPFYSFDHTVWTFNGHMAYAISNKSSENVTALISLVQKSPVTEQCLNFYYLIGAQNGRVNLSVYVFTDKQRNPVPAWSTVGTSRYPWEYATVSISLKEPYQYSFVAYNKEEYSFLLLDDITVVDGPCPELLTCNFNNGSLCGWQNGDFLSWVVEEPYPETWSTADDAMGSSHATGNFVFLDSESGGPQANNSLIFSPRFPSGASDSWCFAFAYRMFLARDAQALLEVFQVWVSDGHTEKVFSTRNSTAGEWTDVQINLTPGKKDFATLAVYGEIDDPDKPSRIELDNFSMRHHACDAPQSGKFAIQDPGTMNVGLAREPQVSSRSIWRATPQKQRPWIPR